MIDASKPESLGYVRRSNVNMRKRKMMKDKPSSNLLECEEFDLNYLRDLLKERIREATALRNMIRLVETFKMTDADDGYAEEVDTIKRLIHGQIMNYDRRKPTEISKSEDVDDIIERMMREQIKKYEEYLQYDEQVRRNRELKRKQSAAKDSKLANQIEDHYDRYEKIDMDTNKKYGQRELP